MATSKGAAATQRKSKIIEELDAQLEARAAAVGRRDKVNAAWEKAIKRANDRYKPQADAETATIDTIDEGLRAFLSKYRRTLSRRLSPTIGRVYGEVKFIVREKALDLPEDEKPVIERLRARIGGARYLTVTYTLNKKALLKAGSEVLRDLHPLGVRVMKHLFITVKSPQEEKPTILVRRGYRERLR